MNNTFFTSDLHHSHNNILKFTNRSIDTTVKEHNDWLVNLWNSQVSAGDKVYHLGDFSFSKSYDEIAEFISRLNGQIFLINGNHDKPEFSKRLVEEGYAVWQGPYKEIKLNSTKVCLFHYPITIWNNQHHGSWCLHGHSHGSFTAGEGKLLDVGLDSAYNLLSEHRLFTEQDIIDHMSTRKILSFDHHKPKEQ